MKDLEKALGYFENMKDMEKCQPNIVTYNNFLRANTQVGEIKQVNVLFTNLEASIISPDTYTYNGVMVA